MIDLTRKNKLNPNILDIKEIKPMLLFQMNIIIELIKEKCLLCKIVHKENDLYIQIKKIVNKSSKVD